MPLRFFIVPFLLILAADGWAQDHPIKAIYAYKQRIVEGKNDAYKKQTVNRTRYHLYIEQRLNQPLAITTLWVNGQQYTFDTVSVKTPILFENIPVLRSNKNNVELVAATSNRVIQLILLQVIKNGKKQPLHLKHHEVLIACNTGTKLYYAGSKLKELQPKLMK